jgi:hypothetical protein
LQKINKNNNIDKLIKNKYLEHNLCGMSDQDLKLEKLESKVDSLKDYYHSLDKKVEVLSDKINRHFEEDSKNLKEITKALQSIDDSLEEYNTQLKIHMKRQLSNEENTEALQRAVETFRTGLEARIQKLEQPILWINGTWSIAKFIVIVGGATGVVYAFLRWISKLS